MSCRAMVICPASSGYEHRSATTLRVNSTLPAPMIATRIMSDSVPWPPQASKAEQTGLGIPGTPPSGCAVPAIRNAGTAHRAACVCGPSSSRLPWKVRGTLPGTPPSRREAPCPDARTLPGASGAFPSRERHSSLTRSDGGDSYAGGREGGEDAGVGGLVGDELADGGDLADL